MPSRRALLPLLILVGAGCSPPPESAVGNVQLALVKDSYIFDPSITQVVQIYVLRASTASGGITCSDVRGQKFNPDDPKHELLAKPPGLRLDQHDPTKEILFEVFQVPADQQALFLVRGLSQWSGGVFPVAEGCKDKLVFKAGTSNIVEVDITASTGAACGEVTECQAGLSCQRTSDSQSAFYGGYCAKAGCGGDQDCPPGARCVTNSSTSGLCLRGCKTPSDCTWVSGGQAVQSCVGRTGPTSKGCASVCVFPIWNKTGECTP